MDNMLHSLPTVDSRERPIAPVAVVIPAYNIEKFIADTLRSVFSQTVLPSEVIVINDGSTDATAAIARECGATVYDQQNRGLSAARNAGAARASAQWIAFLDGDDIWDREKIARQMSAARLDPQSGLIFCDFWQFDERRCINRSVVHEVHQPFESIERTKVGSGIWRCNSNELCALLPRHCVMVPSTLLIKRELLLAIGGCDETLRYSEDIDLELRIIAKTDALFVDRALVGYRRHASAMSADRLRMRSGDIDVANRVLACPANYLDSTVQWFIDERSTILQKGGRMAVAYGEQELARKWLSESLQIRKRPSTSFWLIVSHLVDNRIGAHIMRQLRQVFFAYKLNRSRTRASDL